MDRYFMKRVLKYFSIWILFVAAGIAAVVLSRGYHILPFGFEIAGWVLIGASIIDAMDIPVYIAMKDRSKREREASYNAGYFDGNTSAYNERNEKLRRKNRKLKQKNKKLRRKNKKLEKFMEDVEIVVESPEAEPKHEKLQITKVTDD